MSNWKQLHQERADLGQERERLNAESRGIFQTARKEGRGLSDEERQRDDEIDARVKEIDARLTEIDEDLERERRQQDREKAMPALPRHDPGEDSQVGTFEMGDGPVHTRLNHDANGPFPTFGHQLQAIAAAAQGDMRAREELLSVPRYTADAQGAGVAIDSDGGFLVQTDFASQILRRMHELGQVINRVRRVPLSERANSIKLPGIDETSRADGSRQGGIQGYWVEEGEAPTATKPTFHRVSLELHKVAALGYATEELLSEAAAMTTIFTEGFAEELLFKVEDAIYEGDGAGKPRGILNANATVSVAKESGQAAATVLHDNLKKMWARLHARSRPNAVWFINQDVEPALDDLAKLIGTGGVEPNYVTYGPDGVLRIKGRPVKAIEYCATLGTVGDIVLADLSQYALIDKGGIQQAQSMHVRFTTDEMTFRATYRVDGELTWKSALTPFKGSNTQSPVITLATRA